VVGGGREQPSPLVRRGGKKGAGRERGEIRKRAENRRRERGKLLEQVCFAFLNGKRLRFLWGGGRGRSPRQSELKSGGKERKKDRE